LYASYNGVGICLPSFSHNRVAVASGIAALSNRTSTVPCEGTSADHDPVAFPSEEPSHTLCTVATSCGPSPRSDHFTVIEWRSFPRLTSATIHPVDCPADSIGDGRPRPHTSQLKGSVHAHSASRLPGTVLVDWCNVTSSLLSRVVFITDVIVRTSVATIIGDCVNDHSANVVLYLRNHVPQ
jgi:hypothetical protein